MSPRHDDMQRVRGMMMRLAIQHRQDAELLRLLPYVALHLAGFRSFDSLPASVRNVVQRLRSDS